MRFASGLICGMALVVATGGQAVAMTAPTEPPPANLVDALEVTATADIRVTIAPGGDMDLETYVVSNPSGLFCGGAHYQYSRTENRKCWIWVKRNTTLTLTAQSHGGYGTGWAVQWVGCEPIGNGAGCTVTPKAEVEIAALFTRPAGK